MDIRRRAAQLLTVVLLGCVLLTGMEILATPAASVVRAQQYAAQHKSFGVDHTRFQPAINPPAQQVGLWHAPSASHSPNLTDKSAGAVSTSKGSAGGRIPGDQADLRTAYSSTTLNPDGTWTLNEFAQPIYYPDARGRWQTIDSSIIPDSSDTGYAFGDKANSWHIHFANTSGGAAIVDAQFPTARVLETLDGAAAAHGAPAGSTILYPNVFPSVDLRYSLSGASLEDSLILHNGQTPNSFSFSYRLVGVQAQQDSAGNILFTDVHDGHVVLSIGDVLMYEADAHGNRGPKSASSSSVQVVLSGNGPDYTVTLVPDHTWLTQKGRQFPVVIDPTLTYSSGDPHTNTSAGNIYADTYDESAHASSNFVSDSVLRIGNCSATPTPALGTGTSRAYLKFPVITAPTAVHVTSASLALWQSTAYSGGGAAITANAITAAWNATTLNWTTHPTGFTFAGSATTSATAGAWVNVDVSDAAYAWWQAGLALNGVEVQYATETKPCEFFYSDDNSDTAHRPSLTINYVQDQTTPSGSATINSGAQYTNNSSVSLATTATDTGAISEWNSNWTTVNGVTHKSGYTGATVNVDSSGTQLQNSTSSCGSTQCWAEIFFSHTITNTGNWPTFTSMFQTDAVNNFQFGAISTNNTNTRVSLLATSSSGFTQAKVSSVSGSYTTYTVNVPISANTWYYGQVAFPLANVAEIYIWPVGQARPSSPTLWYTNVYMDAPGLNFWMYGDNGANLHHFNIANVTMTSKDTNSGTTGYGAYGMDFSNDGVTWTCPAPGSGTWCVAGQRVASWSLSSGDGRKTVSYRSIDNAGNISSPGSAQIIYDTTPPTAAITAPSGNREVSGQVIVSASATDPTAGDGTSSGVASVGLYMDGQLVGSPVTGTATPSFVWDTTNVAPGEHVLTTKATDNAGNTGVASAGVTMVVDNIGQMPYQTFSTRDLPADGHSVSVNVGNGNAEVTHQDLSIPGLGPNLAIHRTYNALTPANNLFGWGWSSDLDEMVVANGDSSVTYHDPNGGVHVFFPNGSGGYVSTPGLFLSLAHNGDGSSTLTATDQSKTNFSAAGYLTSIVDRNGNALRVTYQQGLNLPATVTDAAGRQLTITETGTHITAIAAPGSRAYAYVYDGGGNLTDYTDPANVDTHYTYDSGHLSKVTLNYVNGGPTDQQTNVATSLTYDTNNRLVDLVDPMNFDAGVTYTAPTPSSAGQTAVQQLQTNQTTTPATQNSVYETTTYRLTTDAYNAVGQMTDPMNGVTTYQYNGNEQVTQVNDPDGRVSTSMYDTNGNALTQVDDPGGSGHLNLTTTNTYDADNNLLTSTDPRGVVTQYTYDALATGNAVKVIQNYVANGPVDSQTNVTTTATYDTHGETLTSADPTGVVTQHTYDTQGDATQTVANYKQGVQPDSQTNVTTSATYDALGQAVTATDATGVVTQTTYDIRGNVMQTIGDYKQGAPPDSQTNTTTAYGYDALGRQTSETNALTVVSTTTYDKNGRATQSVGDAVNGGGSDSQTNVIATTGYDAAGNQTLSTDPNGNTVTTSYDANNRPTETKVQSSPGSGGVTVSDSKATYDADGATLSSQVLDGANNPTTTYTYDATGREVTTSAPPANPGAGDQSGQNNVTTATYDADGNVVETKITNSAVTGAVSDTTEAFDALNRPSSKIEQANSSAAQTTHYAYDADGRQTSQSDPGSQTTSATYDALGRATTVTHPDQSQDTSTYDANGQRLAVSNSAGVTSDTYDPLGRVASDLRTVGGVQQTIVSYNYDSNGNKTQVNTSYAGGTATGVTASYDKLDRPATQTDGGRSYTYDTNGNLTRMLVQNGTANAVEQDATYDGGNRALTQTDKIGPNGTVWHTYSYAYDPRGNRTAITEDATTTNYVYDSANQLTQIKSSGGLTLATYTYDANHNRASLVTSAGTTTYTYDSADVQLTSKTDPSGKVTTYAYDTNGNLKTATYDPTGVNQVTTYKYDGNNRLNEVDKPDGSVVTFTFDADGNRTSKTLTASGATTIVNDIYQQGHVAYQTDGAGNLLASFTYDSSGTPTSVTVGNNPQTAPRYYYVYNGHGDVVSLVDGSGNIVASYSYDEFGALTASSESFPGGWTNPYRYDGRDRVRYDAETALYWMRVRAYDPTLGRFLAHDPYARTQTMDADNQPFVYAGNNPLGYKDPDGLRLISASGAVVSTPTQQRAAYGNYQHVQATYYRAHPAPPVRPVAYHPSGTALSSHIKVKKYTPKHWWSAGDWLDLAQAVLLAIAGVALIVGGWGAFAANPLVGLALFLNGVSLIIRALTTLAKVVWGKNSGAYKALHAAQPIVDAVVTLADAVTLASFTGGEGVGIFATLRSTAGLQWVATLTGVDLYLDIDDMRNLAAENGH